MREIAIFEWQAVDSSTVLSQAPGVAKSGAKWEILAGFDTLRLFDLQRTAVLIAIQKGKVDLPRQKMPNRPARGLGNSLANRCTVPLLEIEKRWFPLQLARDLRR